MNSAPLNSAAVNTWRSVVLSVRIAIVANASAFVTATATVWRRSQVSIHTGAADLTGSLRRRESVSMVMQAVMAVRVRVYRQVRNTSPLMVQAVVQWLAHARQLVTVRAPVSVVAAASGAIQATLRKKSLVAAAAQAQTTMTAKSWQRSQVTLNAMAAIQFTPDAYRQIPWDEPAPDERQFMVPAETKTFKVT